MSGNYRTLLVLGLLAFALRFGYAATTGALRKPQTWEQEQIATNLLERHSFLFFGDLLGSYRSYAEPLYPFLAATVYFFTRHNQTALVIVQILIGTATVLLTGWTAASITNDSGVGSAAALIAACHPG